MNKEHIVTLKGAWPHDVSLFWYILTALWAAGIVRLVLSLFKAWEMKYRFPYPSRNIFQEAWETAKGFSQNPTHRDYLLPYVLGALEIFIFPVLINAEAWNFIGAWLGFKVVAQWGHWGENRPAFNRFLIGTALVLIFSVWLALKGFDYPLVKK